MRIARKETENETPIADQTSLSPVSSMEKAEIRAELESNNTFWPIKIMGNVSLLGGARGSHTGLFFSRQCDSYDEILTVSHSGRSHVL